MNFKSNCKNRRRFIDITISTSRLSYIVKDVNYKYFYVKLGYGSIGSGIHRKPDKIIKNEDCEREIQEDWYRRKEYRLLKNLIKDSNIEKTKKRM